MIYVNENYYVAVKDKRCSLHPFFDINSRQCDPSKSWEPNTKYKKIFNLEIIKKFLKIKVMTQKSNDILKQKQ